MLGKPPDTEFAHLLANNQTMLRLVEMLTQELIGSNLSQAASTTLLALNIKAKRS